MSDLLGFLKVFFLNLRLLILRHDAGLKVLHRAPLSFSRADKLDPDDFLEHLAARRLTGPARNLPVDLPRVLNTRDLRASPVEHHQAGLCCCGV